MEDNRWEALFELGQGSSNQISETRVRQYKEG
jgi:hypothetical protein